MLQEPLLHRRGLWCLTFFCFLLMMMMMMMMLMMMMMIIMMMMMMMMMMMTRAAEEREAYWVNALCWSRLTAHSVLARDAPRAAARMRKTLMPSAVSVAEEEPSRAAPVWPVPSRARRANAEQRFEQRENYFVSAERLGANRHAPRALRLGDQLQHCTARLRSGNGAPKRSTSRS